MHELVKRQTLPISLGQAWSFFSNPANLQSITPESMDFRITSNELPPVIYPGMIIKYIVKPMLGIPLKWVTKISEVEKPVYFIDEQLSGPYSIWHHQHHFRETRGGIEMTDIVNYQLPLGILGNIAHQIAIKKKVEKIFEYREHKLKELWPKSKLV